VGHRQGLVLESGNIPAAQDGLKAGRIVQVRFKARDDLAQADRQYPGLKHERRREP